MSAAVSEVGREALVEDVYLRSYLEPFAVWLNRTDISEILVNRPGEVWIERAGAPQMECHAAPAIDATLLSRLASQIARISHQGISRETPLLSATLENGARVQIIAPPATRESLALAIRRHVMTDLTLDDYAATGAFRAVHRAGLGQRSQEDAALAALLEAGDVLVFLRAAVAARKTILLSGGTSSGKTTLLNALLKEIPAHERVIVIEDTPEITLGRKNALGLVAVYGDQGEARVSIDDLLRASLRMRPDRLLVGELRGSEAVTFLRTINTGHPGSLATIHASSAAGAYEQIALMCLQAGLGLTREETVAHAKAMVEVVVQLGRRDGVRSVDEIIFTPG
jgi:type IV secretion system protein VirB11